MSSKPAAQPKPWRREAAGVYRSGDDRFVIESDGPGRWYVRDDHERDELGFPRTTGPYPALPEAKAAADQRRADAPVASPLAARIREAASRPVPRGKGSGSEARDEATVPARDPLMPARDPLMPAPPATPKPPPVPQSPPAPRRTWLDELRERDPDLAAGARSMIAGLDRLGIDGADGIVRRDVLGHQPAVAERLLIEALRRAIATELTHEVIVAEAHRRGIDPEEAGAMSRLAIERAVEAVLRIVADRERLDGQPPRLPGWQLVERGGSARRVRVSPEELDPLP